MRRGERPPAPPLIGPATPAESARAVGAVGLAMAGAEGAAPLGSPSGLEPSPWGQVWIRITQAG